MMLECYSFSYPCLKTTVEKSKILICTLSFVVRTQKRDDRLLTYHRHADSMNSLPFKARYTCWLSQCFSVDSFTECEIYLLDARYECASLSSLVWILFRCAVRLARFASIQCIVASISSQPFHVRLCPSAGLSSALVKGLLEAVDDFNAL